MRSRWLRCVFMFTVCNIGNKIQIDSFLHVANRSFRQHAHQYLACANRQSCFSCLYSHNTKNNPISSDSSLHPKIKKAKKNKYKEFSKINDLCDPFDILLEESREKNRVNIHNATNVNVVKFLNKTEVVRATLPKSIFPDIKNIDPYEPHTFGYTLIGIIVGAHGVHGWLKVQCTSDFPLDRLCTSGIRHLKAMNRRAPRQVFLVQGKHRLSDEYLIQLDQVENRDAAQRLRGAKLYIRDEQKDDNLDANEYAVSDLVGLDIFLYSKCANTVDNKYVGIVGAVVLSEDMSSVPGLGHDYIEIILHRGKGGMATLQDEMVLIPFVPQLVPCVDVTNKKIFIDPPDGLLDLTYVKEEKQRIKGLLPPATSNGK